MQMLCESWDLLWIYLSIPISERHAIHEEVGKWQPRWRHNRVTTPPRPVRRFLRLPIMLAIPYPCHSAPSRLSPLDLCAQMEATSTCAVDRPRNVQCGACFLSERARLLSEFLCISQNCQFAYRFHFRRELRWVRLDDVGDTLWLFHGRTPVHRDRGRGRQRGHHPLLHLQPPVRRQKPKRLFWNWKWSLITGLSSGNGIREIVIKFRYTCYNGIN